MNTPFNIKDILNNESNSLYSNSNHSCKYYDFDSFKEKTEKLTDNMSILSLNIRSLPNKWSHFEDFVSNVNSTKFKLSVIGLSEIWNIPFNLNFKLPGYKPLVYKIRDSSGVNNNAGGGVGLFVDDKFEFEVLENISIFIPHVIETIFIKLKTGKNKFQIIGNIYRPNTLPHGNVKVFNEHLNLTLEKIKNDIVLKQSEGITLIGDFNINLLQHLNHSETNNYLDILLSNELLPLITLPTRITQRSATIIDHISTNLKDDSFDAGILLTDLSDHFAPFFIRNFKIEKKLNEKKKVRKINSETIHGFKALLKDYSWQTVIDTNSPKLAFTNFFSIFNDALDLAFPEVQVSTNKNKVPLNPWMTKGLLISRKRKERLLSKKISKPTPENELKYREYNKLYTHLLRSSRSSYYKDRFKTYSNDIQKTWSTINSVIGREKDRQSIPNYFIHNGIRIDGEMDVAQGFNKFFTKVGPDLSNNIPNSKKHFTDYLNEECRENFVFANITEEIIIKSTSDLKSKSSSGPDCLSSKLLKEIISDIAKPLSHMFNLSFKTGFIPVELKTAKVIPIFKSGDPHNFTNYRPISLLSTFSKLLEKIASSQMVKYMNKFNLLYKHQYGFRKGHNTTHPIMHFLDKIYDALNKPVPDYTLGIFIDLKKAFDTCDHNIILSKLSHFGFRGVANTWFKNYLQNRKQFTVINGVRSTLDDILTGVPQGSVLGPLLFLILINDLPNASSIILSILFADDTTLQLSSNSLEVLYSTANTELVKISDWFRANKLTLNVSKTKYILFRNQDMKVDFSNLELSIDSGKIDRIGKDCDEKYFKFVGVYLDEFLSWDHHLNAIRSKLSCANFAISKIKRIVPEKVKLYVYNSLFKSHISYCLEAWGGVSSSKLRPILMIQKKCIRNIVCETYRAHTGVIFKKLEILKVPDLVKFNSLCFMYKYDRGNIPLSFEHFFTPFSRENRSKQYILNVPLKKKLHSFPSYTLPKTWNNLSLNLKRISTFNTFKKHLKKDIFDSYN